LPSHTHERLQYTPAELTSAHCLPPVVFPPRVHLTPSPFAATPATMTRRVVLAVDGDTPQAVQLVEWAAENLNIRTKKVSGGDEITPPEVHVTILYVTLPPQLPDWGFHALFTGDKLWEGMLARFPCLLCLLPGWSLTLPPRLYACALSDFLVSASNAAPHRCSRASSSLAALFYGCFFCPATSVAVSTHLRPNPQRSSSKTRSARSRRRSTCGSSRRAWTSPRA